MGSDCGSKNGKTGCWWIRVRDRVDFISTWSNTVFGIRGWCDFGGRGEIGRTNYSVKRYGKGCS